MYALNYVLCTLFLSLVLPEACISVQGRTAIVYSHLFYQKIQYHCFYKTFLVYFFIFPAIISGVPVPLVCGDGGVIFNADFPVKLQDSCRLLKNFIKPCIVYVCHVVFKKQKSLILQGFQSNAEKGACPTSPPPIDP